MKIILWLLAAFSALAAWAEPVRGSRHAVRFFGTGTGQVDRAKFRIDPPTAADVGDDFTLEFWMKADPGNDGTVSVGANGDGWITGNVVVDRDIYGGGDYGDFGVALGSAGGAARVLAFGAHNGDWGETIVGTNDFSGGAWRHVAVTRVRSNGLLRIYVDGALDAEGTGPGGDLSYRDGRDTAWTNSDPFLVLGAEKHDAGTDYPSFHGYLDEFRIWSRALSAEELTNVAARVLDPSEHPDLVACWRFEEGTNTVLYDSTAGAITGRLHQALAGNGQRMAFAENPTNTAPVELEPSRLRDARAADGVMSFHWFASWNYFQSLETSTGLASNAWTPLAGWTNLHRADGPVYFTGTVSGADTRFYRVRAAAE